MEVESIPDGLAIAELSRQEWISGRTSSCQFSKDLVSIDILFLQRWPFNLCHQGSSRASHTPWFQRKACVPGLGKDCRVPPHTHIGLQLHLFMGVKLTRCQLGIAGGQLMQLMMKPTKKKENKDYAVWTCSFYPTSPWIESCLKPTLGLTWLYESMFFLLLFFLKETHFGFALQNGSLYRQWLFTFLGIALLRCSFFTCNKIRQF